METAIDAGASAPASDTAPAINTTEPARVTIVEEKTPSIDDTMEATWERIQKVERARAPDGKFAPKNAKPEDESQPVEAQAAPGDEQALTDQPEEAQAEAAATPSIDPPHTWSGAMKAKFASLPPEYRDLQEYAAKRDKEQNDAIMRAGERVKTYEPFDQLIQHHKDGFARRGVSPAQAFAVLLDAQARLDQNPLGGLVQIGLSYGIDLRPILQGQQPQQRQPGQPQGPDPMLAALMQEVQQIKGQWTAEQQAYAQAQEADLQRHIDDFKKDKPYFDEARDDMVALLNGGRAKGLDDAYEKATYANPEIRQRILTDQRKAEDKKRDAEAKAKAEAARKSASINVKSSSVSPNPKTIDDTLEETYRQIQARAS